MTILYEPPEQPFPREKHSCNPPLHKPDRYLVAYRKGTLWMCECGQHWRVSKVDSYGTTKWRRLGEWLKQDLIKRGIIR